MRLSRISLRNFRCYKEPKSLTFENITAIIGRNDVGKSAILEALETFFDERKLDKDDASIDGERDNVEKSCEFESYPTIAVIDEQFKTTFFDEKLLNIKGNLEILKRYNGSLVTPKLTGVYARAVHPTREGYSDLLGLKRQQLIARADQLGVDLSSVNKAVNSAIRAAIWASADDLEMKESVIPLDSEDSKKVWAQISTYLPTFALFKSDRASTDQDDEAQDPLKSAIKEALKSKEQEILEIQAHVEREVAKIAEDTLEKIREMDRSIASTLSPIITPKKWDNLFQTSIVGESGVPFNKRGSGVRRLILLNFFRAKAERRAFDTDDQSVIYAIEEPETSQHPRNQRILMTALSSLASAPGRQVIVTTHTPMLARALPENSLRFVRANEGATPDILEPSEETNREIVRSLGILPDNNVKLFIGVEGKNDISFLKGISRMLAVSGHRVPNLDELEISGEIIFFPLGGGNLALWTSRLQNLCRPEFHLYDRDNTPPAAPKYQEQIDAINAREGCSALCTGKRELENYIHPDAVMEAYQANGNMLPNLEPFGEFEDVPETVAMAVHKLSGSPHNWSELDVPLRKKKMSGAKLVINERAVNYMNPERLKESDPNGDIIECLTVISEMIQRFDIHPASSTSNTYVESAKILKIESPSS